MRKTLILSVIFLAAGVAASAQEKAPAPVAEVAG